MKQLDVKMSHFLTVSADRYGLSPKNVGWIMLAPWLISGVFGVALALPASRAATFRILEENNVVELASFAVFVIGGAWGLRIARNLRKGDQDRCVAAFYALFSIVLVFIGMEEIAWGQQLIGFDTPEAMLEINMQGETTLHNIRGMQGNTELLRLAFGLGGIVGVWLSGFDRFRKIGAPALLLPWFVVVVVLSSVDLFNDFVKLPRGGGAVDKLSELVELLIAIAAALYLVLNERVLSAK